MTITYTTTVLKALAKGDLIFKRSANSVDTVLAKILKDAGLSQEQIDKLIEEGEICPTEQWYHSSNISNDLAEIILDERKALKEFRKSFKRVLRDATVELDDIINNQENEES